MTATERAWISLLCAAIVGAIAQRTVSKEAAILGLTTLQVALVGSMAGAAVARSVRP